MRGLRRKWALSLLLLFTTRTPAMDSSFALELHRYAHTFVESFHRAVGISIVQAGQAPSLLRSLSPPLLIGLVGTGAAVAAQINPGDTSIRVIALSVAATALGSMAILTGRTFWEYFGSSPLTLDSPLLTVPLRGNQNSDRLETYTAFILEEVGLIYKGAADCFQKGLSDERSADARIQRAAKNLVYIRDILIPDLKKHLRNQVSIRNRRLLTASFQRISDFEAQMDQELLREASSSIFGCQNITAILAKPARSHLELD